MIKTDRLNIRPFQEKDRRELVELLQDSTFMEYSDTGALSEAAAHSRFDQILEYSLGGLGKHALILVETNVLIGYCGIEPFELNGKIELELGYRLVVAQRGKGLATEAGRAFIARADFTRLFAYTHPQNLNSLKVLLRLGFTAIGDQNIKGGNSTLFEYRAGI